MRFHLLLALLSLTWVCVAASQVSYDDCCLKYVKKTRPTIQRGAVMYRVQELDGSCNIQAVIFIMRRGRVFCTDPREKWVQDLQRKIDKGRKPKRIPFHRQHLNRG